MNNNKLIQIINENNNRLIQIINENNNRIVLALKEVQNNSLNSDNSNIDHYSDSDISNSNSHIKLDRSCALGRYLSSEKGQNINHYSDSGMFINNPINEQEIEANKKWAETAVGVPSSSVMHTNRFGGPSIPNDAPMTEEEIASIREHGCINYTCPDCN
jgi:hypothetical protein